MLLFATAFAALFAGSDTIFVEVGAREVDGRIFAPHAARVRVYVDDVAVSDWINELTLGDSAGRKVMRWVTVGLPLASNPGRPLSVLKQTYDAITLAPYGISSTSSSGAMSRLAVANGRVTGVRRTAASPAEVRVDLPLARPGFVASASDLVPVAAGLVKGSVIVAPVWGPNMTAAEDRVFTVLGDTTVMVEGAPARSVRVEERRRSDRVLLAVWYLTRDTPYMVYGEVPMPDGRIQRMTEVSLPLGSGARAETERMVDALMGADRAASAAAQKADPVVAMRAAFARDVTLQLRSGHATGATDAATAFAADLGPDARMRWTPVRGGVSSDGTHGFTFGYTVTERAGGPTAQGKYIAYWVREDGEWRIAAYKRVPGPAGEVSLDPWAPALPTPGLVAGDAATIERYRQELHDAEVAFSRDAGPLGLAAAFVKHGAPDAVNAGSPAEREFVRGNEAIGALIGDPPPGATISWAPSRVLVAPTGDLGVSIGTIRMTSPAAAGAAGQLREVPFFTIWRRAGPGAPWKYVAE